MPQMQKGEIQENMDTVADNDTQIPDFVRDLLNPISTDSPVGNESSTDEEYFRLEMEIGKPSPNYKVAIELASSILQEKSKDLRVASWLCFAWYRDEKIPGLKNGLLLLFELLNTFRDKLYPENIVHRAKALQLLNSSRFVKILEKEEPKKEDAPLILDIGTILDQLIAVSAEQFPENPPDLKALSETVSSHAETAQKLIKEKPSEPEKKPAETKEIDSPKKEDTQTPPGEENPKPEQPKPAEIPAADVTVGVTEISVSSDSEARSAIKKVLNHYFKLDADDERKYSTFLYGISRSLIWSDLAFPPHKDSVSQLPPPDSEIKTTLESWFTNKEWKKLVSAVEVNVLNEDSTFKYWLTAQKYVADALENIGGQATKAAEEIKFQLAMLLRRLPNMENLKFNDDMPFADDKTLEWINEEVNSNMHGNESQDMILPPILGEDYAPINKEYEDACAELPDKFGENMEKMQRGIAADTRRKGKFLRTLNLANFLIQAKKFELAKVHLVKLVEKIEAYQLAEWEPALCTSTWESTYLINVKLIEKEKNEDEIDSLNKQQSDLFAKIGNYNGLLALKLAKRKIKKGE
jgi:type VI secretion system protein VasJ